VVGEFSALLKSYRVSKITGDRYAGEWLREHFRKHGIIYEPAQKPKSDLYRDLAARHQFAASSICSTTCGC
jgi:hypothetical protein